MTGLFFYHVRPARPALHASLSSAFASFGRTPKASLRPSSEWKVRNYSPYWGKGHLPNFHTMCGIVAVLGATDNAATRKLILDLSRRLRHRGPDWSGIHQARGRGMTGHGEGRRAATSYEFCDSFIPRKRLGIVSSPPPPWTWAPSSGMSLLLARLLSTEPHQCSGRNPRGSPRFRVRSWACGEFRIHISFPKGCIVPLSFPKLPCSLADLLR